MSWAITNLLRAWRFRRLMSRAQRFASRGEIYRSLEVFIEVFRTYGQTHPTSDVPVIANLLFSDLSSRLGKSDDALLSCEVVLEQLEGIDVKLTFTDFDISYLKYICKWILAGLSDLSDSIPFTMALSIDATYSSLDIENVAPELLNLFPLTPEFGIEFDSFILQNTAN